MANNLIGTKSRELSQEEIIQFNKATQKWYPKLFQTYNTTLFEMVASPIKKAIIHVTAFLIIVGIVVLIFGFDKQRKKISFGYGFNSKIYIGVIVVVSIVIAVITAIGQYKSNDNIRLMMTMTKPGATKYDYESSPVIQGKLMRNSYRNGSSSFGGSVLGAGLGSLAGSRSRRRGR